MALPTTRGDREFGKFKESVSVANQPAVAVVNPDGTNIAGGGGGGGDGAILDGVTSTIRATVLDTPGATPAGTDNPVLASLAGSVLPAGTNNIGDVDVVTLPPLPAGANTIGDVGTQTKVRNPGDTAWENVGPGSGQAKIPARLFDAAGNAAVVANASPAATDYGLVIRSAGFTAITAGEGAITPLGSTTDAEAASGNASLVALLKRLRTLLAGGLPAALTAGGNLKAAILEALPAGTNNIGDVDVLTQPGAASIANGQVTVTTTAANVVAARATRRALTIVNHGTADVYLGVATVTTANGVLLVGTKGAAVTLFTTAAVQAIVASGTQAVSYVEEYD